MGDGGYGGWGMEGEEGQAGTQADTQRRQVKQQAGGSTNTQPASKSV